MEFSLLSGLNSIGNISSVGPTLQIDIFKERKMINSVETKNAPAAIGPYSQAKIVGNMIFTSGQIPLDPETGLIQGETIVAQTLQVIANIEAILGAAGSSLENVFKTTCFLAEMEDFSEFNAVYEKHFPSKPARSCVAVKQLPKSVLVEVEVIALIP